ncbi:outer membrane lipoprotein chaperone LolA [Candidatus Sororendozoicomonas aggregata]|uniref:outer membrane lipoprotein chaperone LolA n=1 Tax=Candidatus Sororendozoicomonas aggregata TaxID=3073239 RepID=UPI002ED0CB83
MLKPLFIAMTLTMLSVSASGNDAVTDKNAPVSPASAAKNTAIVPESKTPAQGQSDAKAVAALVKKLESIKTLSASFQQEMMTDNGRRQTLSGKLSLKRPNKFLWHTTKPYEQEIITRDNKVWNIDHDLMQVVIQKQDTDSENTPVSLLSGDAREFLKNYYVTVETFRESSIYSLRPSGKGALFEKLDIHFNKDGELTGFAMVDSLGGKRQIDLRQVNVNGMISDSQFNASYPKNYDVIDEATVPSQPASPAPVTPAA